MLQLLKICGKIYCDSSERRITMFNKMLRNLSALLVTVFYKIKYRIHVTGAENIPKDGGVLLCSNHRSAEDPIFLYMAVPKRYIYYFAKEALAKNRFLKWYMCDVLGIKTVSHTAADISTIRWGVNMIKNGEVVGIFPEGTRNRTEKPLLDFQSGAAIVAHMAKAKVVTAAITCSGKWFSKCEIVFSGPLELDDLYSQRLTEDVKNKITQKIQENVCKSLKK